MRTLEDIFAAWDTLTDMAVDVGENRWTVEKWKERGRIPSDAWPALIAAVKRKGQKLSADNLLTMHTGSRRADARACG